MTIEFTHWIGEVALLIVLVIPYAVFSFIVIRALVLLIIRLIKRIKTS